MQVVYHPEVRQDLAQIVLYYNSQQEGCSERFFGEYEQTLTYIKQYATVFRQFYSNIRKLNLKSFPFAILYQVMPESIIYVVAIADLRRKPFYWTERLEN